MAEILNEFAQLSELTAGHQPGGPNVYLQSCMHRSPDSFHLGNAVVAIDSSHWTTYLQLREILATFLQISFMNACQ